jgi:F0F1-type ATP synthase assembly protein I
MRSGPSHSGEMSQDSERGPVHRTGVQVEPPAPVLRPAIDPAARVAKGMYQGLSASSAGLELGIAVGISTLFGSWLDGKLGTAPWMMMVFLVLGSIAGFRGVLRAVARADREAREDQAAAPGKAARHG